MDLVALIGPEPASQRERLVWRNAVEATAVYRARWTPSVDADREMDPVAAVLGGEPARGPMRNDYRRVRETLEQATANTRTQAAEPDAGWDIP